MQMVGDVGAGDVYTFWGGAWDPHDANRLGTSGGNSVQARFSVDLLVINTCITACPLVPDFGAMPLLYSLVCTKTACPVVHEHYAKCAYDYQLL